MTSAQQRFGVVVISVVAGLIAIAWLSRAPPAPEPLSIAVADNFLGVPLWVAERQGFFAPRA